MVKLFLIKHLAYRQAGYSCPNQPPALTYRHAKRTLTDKEVAKVHAKIAKRLDKEIGAKLRE